MSSKNTNFKLIALLVILPSCLFAERLVETLDQHVGRLPAKAYAVTTTMTYEGSRADPHLITYLPESNNNQKILSLDTSIDSGSIHLSEGDDGKLIRWNADLTQGTLKTHAIVYRTPVSYELEEDARVPTDIAANLKSYLESTNTIAVSHPEIKSLWTKIEPMQSNSLIPVLRAIYNYTASLKPLPFKGPTDALTALRLGAASCNGKSRLFVSLARLNGIPARLVGGIVLNPGKKRISHQWVEVFIQDQWVPFDPTNKHFAEIPANYLELYKGDQPLFRYSPRINFEYQFDISETLVPPTLLDALYPDKQSRLSANWLVWLSDRLGVTVKQALFFLLLPVCALVISFLRNVVGVNSFGVFMPMLVAFVCASSSLILGLGGLVVCVGITSIALLLLQPFNLLKVPRLAAALTILSVVIVIGILILQEFISLSMSVLTIFPVIVLAFLADKLTDLIVERQWREILLTSLGTLYMTVACYLVLESTVLKWLFSEIPGLLAFVFLAQLYLGRWSGIRLSELLRFSKLFQAGADVLGINSRNLNFVQKKNDRKALVLAGNKIETKRKLKSSGINVPDTIVSFKDYGDIHKLDEILTRTEDWVLKPNRGSQGKGILVFSRSKTNTWIASGKAYSKQNIIKHIIGIINGDFTTSGLADEAFIEPRIQQIASLQSIAPTGLCDLRVIVYERSILSAMLRLPTLSSSGKANLHQGAVGVAINLRTGKAIQNPVDLANLHPDTDANLDAIELPEWKKVRELALRSTSTIALGYAGVDICFDAIHGPLVLEVNGRPGLEIQNISNKGLIDQIKRQRSNEGKASQSLLGATYV